MKEVTADPKLIAYCGLYCGACRKYLNEQCPGCANNQKASWCKVRSCNMEHGYSSCAACQLKDSVADCKDYNNFMSKVFGFIFRSDRAACIAMIKEKGPEEYARFMADSGMVTIKR